LLKDDSVPTGVKDAIKITKAIVVVGLNPTIARYGEALPFIVGTYYVIFNLFCIQVESFATQSRWPNSDSRHVVGSVQKPAPGLR
jgi:hypothetical protein